MAGYTGTLSIVDRFGRRPLLAISALIMAFGLLGIAIFFNLDERREGDYPQQDNSTEAELREVDNEIVDDLFWLPLVSERDLDIDFPPFLPEPLIRV